MSFRPPEGVARRRFPVRRTDPEISARNRLRGTVKRVTVGSVMAEVVVDINGQEIVAAITRHSAESMRIKQGEQVTADVKATEVMIAK